MKSVLSKTAKLNVARLHRRGFEIVDDFFDSRCLDNWMAELKALQDFDILYKCHTHSHLHAQSKPMLTPKQNVFELELHSYPELSEVCVDLCSLMNSSELCDTINQGEVFASESGLFFNTQTLKCLFAQNGGCFPIHYDTDHSLDNRTLTGVIYLNDIENDGHLRLFPLTEPEPISVPIHRGRMVVFSSASMLHSTLPCTKDRYCLNLWIHASRFNVPHFYCEHQSDHIINEEEDINDEMNKNDRLNVLNQLLSKRMFKYCSKVLFADQWRHSIENSHDVSEPEVSRLLDSHESDVRISKQALSDYFSQQKECVFVRELQRSLFEQDQKGWVDLQSELKDDIPAVVW